jgi:hypothetical protein
MTRISTVRSFVLAIGGLVALWSATATAQPTAEYTVDFDATWSAQTHPLGFPSNPHFSGLIGGTHNDQVTFWEEGELASPGIKRMAELGSKTVLRDEIETAIAAGTAAAVISGGGIGTSPGSVSETFTIEETHALVTLVSMLAPSPDWFVGVSGIDLRPGGQWVDVLVVDLVIWDAGTDSGTEYGSPNMPTVPPVPIFEKMDGPFAQNNVVGTFTFTRSTVSVGESETPARQRLALVPLGPNPTRSTSRFEINVPQGRTGDLAVYDVNGRLVRALLRNQTSGPAQVVVWDGRDDRGARVSAGVYYVRLDMSGSTRTEKIVIAR